MVNVESKYGSIPYRAGVESMKRQGLSYIRMSKVASMIYAYSLIHEQDTAGLNRLYMISSIAFLNND